MADERSLSELLWDYGVYAPIGLAAAIVDELPRLTDKGKERAANQIHTARMIGKLAVGEGKRQMDKLFGVGHPSASPASSPPASATTRATPPSAPGSSTTSPAGSSNGSAGGPATTPHAADAFTRPSGASRTAPGATTVPSRPRSSATSAPKAPASKQATRTASKAPASSGAGTRAQPAADSLAIPGYDTLAASQVVQRLSSLRPDELEAIRRYELSTRGRRTILHRVAQLAADR